MIGPNRTFQNIDFVSRTDLSDDLTESVVNILSKYFLSIFSPPDYVVLVVV